ncbi:MAG: hypothetical protein AB7N73_14990 [Gemmatimonadales bacterium]
MELLESVSSSVESAVDYLRGQWDRFVNLSPDIIDLQHRAAVAAYHAEQAGDLERADQARAIIRALGALNVKHGEALEAMNAVRQYVGLGSYVGLGAIPAAQVTALTALAAVVAWAFRAYAAEERKLELIESGVVTPEQLALLDPGPAPVLSQATALAKLLLVGFGLFLGFRLLESSGVLGRIGRARPRRNPPLIVFDSNPPGGKIGEEVLAVWYEHAEDGRPYVHEFGPDVELYAEPDGGVRLEHRRGRELWADFELDEDELDDEEEELDDDELEELGIDEDELDDDGPEDWGAEILDDDDDDDGGAW